MAILAFYLGMMDGMTPLTSSMLDISNYTIEDDDGGVATF